MKATPGRLGALGAGLLAAAAIAGLCEVLLRVARGEGVGDPDPIATALTVIAAPLMLGGVLVLVAAALIWVVRAGVRAARD